MQTNRKPHAVLSVLARAASACILVAAVAPAQTPDTPSLETQMVEAAERLCRASDPTVRGEAALVLAGHGDTKHHPLLLTIAKDTAQEARLRGLLALGLLGAPGCEHVLREQIEASSTRPQPEGVTAAFALGRLPDAHAPALVSDQLGRVLGASFKRPHEGRLALVLGLTTHAAQAQRLALLQLLDSASLRELDLRIAVLQALARIPNGLDRDRWSALMAKGSAEERRAVLQCTPRLACAAELQPLAADLCSRDADPGVRAQALAALTQLRHPRTLDLARKALASTDPEEAGQAVRSLWLLGGSSVADELGAALRSAPAITLAAMLTECAAPMNEPTQAFVQKLAKDRASGSALRAAAALALGRAQVPAAAPLLRDAFVATQDAALLRLLAPVLLHIDSAVPSLDRLHQGSSATELALQPERLTALLLAGHPAAEAFCVSIVTQKGQPPAAVQGALRSWRSRSLALLLPDTSARRLPSPLRELR
jgi:HEAT repeat protein